MPKPWKALTDRGKAQRLRPLVADVLACHGLHRPRVRLLEVATNVVFRVDTGSGRYALKVDVTDEHTDAHMDIALAWLAAVQRDTDIAVVAPVSTVDGRPWVVGDADGVPPGRRCVLYRWVPGRTIFDAPTPALFGALGRVMARLHEHAATYVPTGEPDRWDRVFYYPNEPVITDEPGTALSDRQRDLVRRAVDKVGPVLASLYDEPARLIHADLHGWNVQVHRGRLTLLDFDDVMWGQPVHDIAITFGYKQGHADYPAWIEAFEAGYRSIAAWPVTDPGVVSALKVARRLMFTNAVLQRPAEDWSKAIDGWCKTFEAYVD